MNIQNIITYLTIIETKSLSKAAEKLFVSQSTISSRLNALEKELRSKLIARNPGKKTIEVTPKGEDFIPIAKQWISLYKDTHMWINKVPNIKLNIGAIDTINSYVFPSLFKDILEEEIPLYIDISTHSSMQIFDSLETHAIDLGITSRLVKNDNLYGEAIFSENMVMISNIYSNYSDVVHPDELDVRNEIFQDWGPNFLLWHDYWWDPSVRKNIVVDTARLISICIELKDSWSIVPLSVARAIKKSQPIKMSELFMPPDERVYYKIKNRYPRPRSLKALETFENLLSKYIKESPYFHLI